MVKIGIIGTNSISGNFVQAAKEVEGCRLTAVYSRRRETGDTFASEHGIELVYTSLEALCEASDVDAVYIASPNSLHGTQAIRALSAGKHVLCEKTAASNADEWREVMEKAKEKKLVLLEAMRPVYTPGFAKMRELLPELGAIRRVEFRYCQYSSRYDKFKEGIIMNAFNPAFSNAALMDIGVYCVHPLVELFGKPDSVCWAGVKLHNGMEGAGTVLAQYPHMVAELQYSKITDTRLPSQIQGEHANMVIDSITNPGTIRLEYRDGHVAEVIAERKDNNMYYEIAEFVRLIEQGETGEDRQHATLLELELMDDVRKQAGILFEGDR